MFNEASGRVPARVKRWLPHVAADREDLCADGRRPESVTRRCPLESARPDNR